jgi:hypothetical protein
VQRTPEQLLRDYQRFYDQMPDVPEPLRTALVQGAIRRRYGRLSTDVLGFPIHPALTDLAWRTAQVLEFLHLDHLWPGLVQVVRERGADRGGLHWLAERLSPKEREDVFYRLLCLKDIPSRRPRLRQRIVLWTKGGSWYLPSGFTTILVEKGHLERLRTAPAHFRYSDSFLRAVELELQRQIDPDRLFPFLCRQKAVSLAKSLLRVTTGRVVAWFFQSQVWERNAHGFARRWYYDARTGEVREYLGRAIRRLPSAWTWDEWYELKRKKPQESARPSALLPGSGCSWSAR